MDSNNDVHAGTIVEHLASSNEGKFFPGSPVAEKGLARRDAQRSLSKLRSRAQFSKSTRPTALKHYPGRFQPRPSSPKPIQPSSVTATVSSSLMKPRLGCAIVVSIDRTMSASRGRVES